MYPIIHLFGHAVQSYYVCAACAGIAGVVLAALSLRKEKLGAWSALFPILLAAVAVIGARLLNFVTNPGAYGGDFSLWTFSYTKLSLMGGLVLGVGGILAFGAAKRKDPLRLLDAFCLPAAAGIALLKLGCFLNGCCFGKPTDGVFGMVFPANASKYSFLEKLHLPVTSPCVHPTQLYEIFGAAASFALALLLEKKCALRSGGRFAVFAFGFALTRLIVLPLRVLPYADTVKGVFYPILYLAIMAVCAAVFIRSVRKTEKQT